MVPLYEGKSKANVPLVDLAMDGTIEMLQKYSHSINFNNNNNGSKK